MINGGINGHTATMYKTRVIQNTLNPVWNEDGIVAGISSKNDILLLTLFDRDIVSKDDFLGILCKCFLAYYSKLSVYIL